MNKPTPTAPNIPPANAEKTPAHAPKAAKEAWEELLEEDADCCGGCHHKPR